MRGILISFIMWLGILQVPITPQSQPLTSVSQLLGVAGALATLTVMVYRLGVWRQEMYNTKHGIGADVARCREELGRAIERLERRFGVFDQFVSAANEQRVATERWQARIDTLLQSHDKELAGVVGRLGRIEMEGAR